MSNVSLHAIDQFYRSESEDPALLLLTIDFPNSNSFYFVNNTENIVSNGQEFTAFPFNFTLPDDETDAIPELNISLDNIGLDLIDDFSSVTDSIRCKINLVFASNPDFSELEIKNLIIKNIVYNKFTINITVSYEDILNTQIPSNTYNAVDFPGIFNA